MNITVSQPFPFEIEGLGTIMDYVEDRFLFIVKDEFWSEEEKAMLMQEPMEVALYYRYDVAVFLVSGGDIDTSDFYFNVQECEWKEQLLSSTTLQASLILLDQDNIVCCRRDVTFPKADSQQIIQLLREQAPGVKVMVGGAVLTQEYADSIGADFYGKDAMASVRYATELAERLS